MTDKYFMFTCKGCGQAVGEIKSKGAVEVIWGDISFAGGPAAIHVPIAICSDCEGRLEDFEKIEDLLRINDRLLLIVEKLWGDCNGS